MQVEGSRELDIKTRNPIEKLEEETDFGVIRWLGNCSGRQC